MKTARNIGVIETKRDSPCHVQAKADPEIKWGWGGGGGLEGVREKHEICR